MHGFDETRFIATIALTGAVCAGLASVPTTAHGFSTESAVRHGCHEQITVAAVESAGWPGGVQPPAPDETTRRILDDTAFELPAGIRDPWSVSMLLGNRHVDLRGHERSDFVALAHEAAKPDRQPEHCLRKPEHDGEQGNVEALAACRAWILEQIGLALGSGSEVNLYATEEHEVVLDFRGPIDIALPRYAFRMGMALHAVQDGFSHLLRTEDGRGVTAVMNYAEWVDGNNDYSERKDGLGHLSQTDRCGSDQPQHQQERVDLAARASAELLVAVNDPAGGRAGRLARAEEVLDRWFTFVPGCTIDNDYCGSPALEDWESTCSVADTAPRGRAWWGLLPILVAVGLLGRRRIGRFIGLAAPLLILCASTPALAQYEGVRRAQDEDLEETQDKARDEGAEVVGVSPDGEEVELVERRTADSEDLGAPINRGFGMRLGLGGAIDEEGGHVQLGFRVDTLDWLTLGVDVEYNPWFSLETLESAPGAGNLYLTGIFTYGVVGPVELRTTAHAGVSMLLWDMVGADRFSVGPAFGVTPLGVAFRAGRVVRITVDPGGVFFAIPKVQGVPLIHREHRFTVGVRFTP